MIPLFGILKIRAGLSARKWWIPLPLFLLWLLILPFFVLILPLLFIACLVTWVPFFRSLKVMWQIFCATRGTRIEVDAEDAFIEIQIC